MGFKCPKCKQDFGLNQEALTRHLLTNPTCALTSSFILSTIQEVMEQLDNDNDNANQD